MNKTRLIEAAFCFSAKGKKPAVDTLSNI